MRLKLLLIVNHFHSSSSWMRWLNDRDQRFFITCRKIFELDKTFSSTFCAMNQLFFVLLLIVLIWSNVTVQLIFFLAISFQDEGMSYFVEHGRFPAERYEYPRKSRNLLTVLVWNVILCLPLVWYIISVILSGSIASFLTAGTIALVGKLYLDQ